MPDPPDPLGEGWRHKGNFIVNDGIQVAVEKLAALWAALKNWLATLINACCLWYCHKYFVLIQGTSFC